MYKKLVMILLFLLTIGIVSATYTYSDPLEVSGLTVEEFKEQCVDVSYKDLKTDDSLINQSVKLKGEVGAASHNSMTFYVDGDNDQEVFVHLFENKDNAKFKKYEGLDATIYCRVDGTEDLMFSGEVPAVTIVDIE